MDKYLSIITNFGCHGRCPYCIVRENGIKVPKSTIGGLDKLEDAIKMTGANEEINRISDFVRCSDQIDELSFRQMVNDRYETEYYNDDFLKAGHNKGLWHYIRQKDYNIYYAENRIYTKFSEIEADIQEER